MKDHEGGNYYKTLDILHELSESLISVSPEEFLQMLPEKVCQILDVPVCILWVANQEQQKFQIFATAGEVDDDYKEIKLDFKHPGIQHLFTKNEILSLADVNKSEHRFGALNEINKRQWISFMSAPLTIQEKMIGILDVFTNKSYIFKKEEKQLLGTLANYAVSSFKKIKSLREKEEIDNEREKLQKLTNIIHDMTAASQTNKIWKLLKKGAEELVESKYIWIGRWNHLNGELKLVEANQSSKNLIKLKFGKGIITQVINHEKPIIVSNTSNTNVQGINYYIQTWNDTQSELAIPLVDSVLIRERTEVKKIGSKIIGVLNIESTKANAFSTKDKERLSLLARHAAIRLEKLNFFLKTYAIREIEQKITESQSFNEIINIILKGIRDVLEFEWINISLVNPERTEIKSEYVVGISKEQEERFKKEAINCLESQDIHADIVRTKNIEVPDNNDPRLDPEIFQNYEHQDLIRVFIPMIEPSSNLVIGTVEAGYKRKYRKYIYEQDITILRSFIDYAVRALERKKSGLIDKITHELKSPIVGIKANASFLQTRFSDVRIAPQLITIKIEDIITDCELLTYQIRQFDYFSGRRNTNQIKQEKTIVFRDIIIKTIHQLKFHLQHEYGFSINNIVYHKNDIKRIVIFTDKTKLNQVVYNLFMNAFKYAEKDSTLFKIVLEIEEDNKFFTIKFKDWGIGIREEDENKIFEEGFRSPEVIATVGGSGLGLTISKTIMKQLGGDLKLVNNYKPTEFDVILPKKLNLGEQ